MNKTILRVYIAIRELCKNALRIAYIFLPGLIIDDFIVYNDTKKAIIDAMYLSIITVTSNMLISFSDSKAAVVYERFHYDKDLENSKRVATLRFQEYERTKESKMMEMLDIVTRDPQRRQTEAVFEIVSQVVLIGTIVVSYRFWNPLVHLAILIPSLLSAYAKIRREKLEFSLKERYAALRQKVSNAAWSMISVKYAKEARSYGLVSYILGRFDRTTQDYYDEMLNEQRENRKTDWIPSVLKGIEIVLSFGLSGALFARGDCTIGTFVVTVSVIQQLFEAEGGIAKSIVTYKTEQSYKETYSRLEKETEGYTGTETLEGEFDQNWTIEFKDVCFRYPNAETNALEGINLIISKGDKLSLVGENGSGKSTFVKLLLGFYKPTSGSILLNGVDLEQKNMKDYLNHISVIFQDFTILECSIRDNLLMSRKNDSLYSAEKLYSVLERVDLTRRVESFPKKLETVLSRRFCNDGALLSGGENQKLALARAMVKEHDLIVFDEPTSSMSATAENEMYEWYRKAAQHSTSVFISHRLAGSRLANCILVFEEGKIKEKGNHEALIANQTGIYRQMFLMQAQNYVEVDQ